MQSQQSAEDIAQSLFAAATAAFGAERAEAQRQAIAATAAAIAQILRHPLDPADQEPDFINAGDRA